MINPTKGGADVSDGLFSIGWRVGRDVGYDGHCLVTRCNLLLNCRERTISHVGELCSQEAEHLPAGLDRSESPHIVDEHQYGLQTLGSKSGTAKVYKDGGGVDPRDFGDRFLTSLTR